MNLPDRAKAALAALVRQLASRYDYAAGYTCRIVSQNGDGSLELAPELTTLPSLSRVPIRYGLPNVTAKVAAGGKVLLTFENMDPARPVATVFDTKDVLSISFDGGNQPVARQGDTVSVLLPTGAMVIMGMVLPTGGLIGTMVVPDQLIGVVMSGNPKIMA